MTPHLPGHPQPSLPGRPPSSVPCPSLKGGCPCNPVLDFSPPSPYPFGQLRTPNACPPGHLSPELHTHTPGGHWARGCPTDAANSPCLRGGPTLRPGAPGSGRCAREPPGHTLRMLHLGHSPLLTNHRAQWILTIPQPLPLPPSPFLQHPPPGPGHLCLPLAGRHGLLRDLPPLL